MILGLSIYFILMDFYIFSIAGWIYESSFVSIRDRKLVNRGFLVGPMIPLYGFGAVLVYVLLRPFSKVPSLLYVMGMIVATVIEYITSWLLEVLFHAKWWDYSKEPYNFQGRIALIPSMFWGILSLLMFDVLQPAATFLIECIPEETGWLILAVFVTITVIDVVYTVVTTINFRKQLENLYEFRKELEYLLEDMKLSSLKDMLSSTTKELSGRFQMSGFFESKELVFQKLNSMRSSVGEGDSRFAALEEKFRMYWEKSGRFLKKTPLIGNQRLVDAFPTMKIVTKNHSAVEVKELLLNLKQRAVPRRKGSKDSQEEGEDDTAV